MTYFITILLNFTTFRKFHISYILYIQIIEINKILIHIQYL